MPALQNLVKKCFTPVNKPGKCVNYCCIYCKKNYTWNTTRMKIHLFTACKKCPNNVKEKLESICGPSSKKNHQKKSQSRRSSNILDSSGSTDDSFFVEKVNNSNSNGKRNSSESYSSELEQEIDHQNKRARVSHQVSVETFVDHMDAKELNYLHKLFAKAIYASGLPLSFPENHHWKQFFKALRPAFTMPTRDKLSNELLDEVYQEVEKVVEEKIEKAPGLGIQCDGWTNVNNEGIVNFIVTTPTPLFVKSLPTKGYSHTADYMTEEINKVIRQVGKNKVIAVTTDNAPAMIRGAKQIKDTFQWITSYGCTAHVLNLVIKDLTSISSIEKIIEKAKKIIKHIKNSTLLLHEFKTIQLQSGVTTTLKLPPDTRFGYTYLCLESLLVNKSNLKQLAIKENIEKKMDAEILTLILKKPEVFWFQLATVTELFKPLFVWISKLETDSPVLSLVTECMAELKSHFKKFVNDSEINILTEKEGKDIMTKFENRKEMAIQPIHLAANILDPSFKGKNLDKTENDQALDYIHDLANHFDLDIENFTIEINDYLEDRVLWAKEYIKTRSSIMNAFEYWNSLKKMCLLSGVAAPIFCLNGTTGPTERSFSTHAWIHSIKRNRLLAERSGKITYIAHNLKLFFAYKTAEKKRRLSSQPRNHEDVFDDLVDGCNEDQETDAHDDDGNSDMDLGE